MSAAFDGQRFGHSQAMSAPANASSGQTPYGFGFVSDGALIVSEAFGGAAGAAAASSYALSRDGELTVISESVGNTRSEVCWVVVTRDDGSRS